jgi:hypothetical protein
MDRNTLHRDLGTDAAEDVCILLDPDPCFHLHIKERKAAVTETSVP